MVFTFSLWYIQHHCVDVIEIWNNTFFRVCSLVENSRFFRSCSFVENSTFFRICSLVENSWAVLLFEDLGAPDPQLSVSKPVHVLSKLACIEHIGLFRMCKIRHDLP